MFFSLLSCSFPFDKQNCSLIYMFDDYSASEVNWKFMDYNITRMYKENSVWKIIKETEWVSPLNTRSLTSRDVSEVAKSQYIYSLKMTRNPIQPIIFVVCVCKFAIIFSQLFSYFSFLDMKL